MLTLRLGKSVLLVHRDAIDGGPLLPAEAFIRVTASASRVKSSSRLYLVIYQAASHTGAAARIVTDRCFKLINLTGTNPSLGTAIGNKQQQCQS